MIKKPLEFAAWCYIALLGVGVILGGISSFVPQLSLIIWLVSIVLTIFIYYGFIVLGRKLKSKFLVVVSWVGIVLSVLLIIYFLVGSSFIDTSFPSEEELLEFSNQSQESPEDIDLTPFYGFFKYLLTLYLIYSFVFGVLAIFLGIGLLKIRKKIKYAKPAGILNIIAGATLFIFVGYIVMIVAIIYEILLLFEASKRFEKKEKNGKTKNK